MTDRTLPQEGLRAWLPVLGLAFAAFTFNTSEFLPVGLLPDMAAGLGETVSDTGLIITGYAWVVAIMSLPLTLLTAKIERRRLLLGLIAVFALCHVVVLWTNTFESLLAARIGVAFTHSVFWSIMTPLAARMAPRGKRAVGLAAVMGGTIVATVLGVPIGTQLGHFFGWQEAFCVIGAAAFACLVLIWAVLPECPSNKAGSLAALPGLLKRPALLQLYFLTAVTVLGQFTAYSYVSPILAQAGYGESDVVTVLLVFGLAGILGTVVSTKTVDRFTSATLTVPLVVIALSLAFFNTAANLGYAELLVLTLFWGAAMTTVCMAFQTVVLNVASDAADIAVSLYSGIFNIGIGTGAFTGSLISARWGFEPVASSGAAFVAVSAVLCLALWVTTKSAVLPGGEKPAANTTGEEVPQ